MLLDLWFESLQVLALLYGRVHHDCSHDCRLLEPLAFNAAGQRTGSSANETRREEKETNDGEAEVHPSLV